MDVEITLEERYAKFHHWMKNIKGYMHCPSFEDIKSWEDWEGNIEGKDE